MVPSAIAVVNGDILGNGIRLVGVPVNDGTIGATRTLEGFAGFFLSNSSTNVYYNGTGSQPFCAEYYGTWSKDQLTKGDDTPVVIGSLALDVANLVGKAEAFTIDPLLS